MRGVGNKIDRPLLIIIALLVFVGFFLFSSASLGLLAREGARFSSVAFSQLVLGIGLGSVALFIVSRIHYRFLKQYSIYFFIFALILTLLVFVPSFGFSSGGATRWISLFGLVSIQPAEILKIATILYLATYLANMRGKLSSFKTGLIPFALILLVPAIVLLLQPDTSTLVVIAAAAVGMFFAAGAKWRDIGILILVAILALGVLVTARPYVLDRITTFMHPAQDQLGSGYQIKQSLIAVGSGKIAGRGFGQSVQKFGYLPEPTGDSVFAVAAEEFGFIGAVLILGLFVALVIRALWVAVRAPDYFGGLVVIGLTLLISTQALINIASMLGVIPLTGLPLPFISHGGTAMLVMLASMGVILNVSKYAK
ncbi:putative lipid II flippase FtsW [Candidatus Kaiserbacteria bacterium]|nr:MAG: putative lipid II flippase FtsW [Candidatus Kaiserbacteria bacterium]